LDHKYEKSRKIFIRIFFKLNYLQFIKIMNILKTPPPFIFALKGPLIAFRA